MADFHPKTTTRRNRIVKKAISITTVTVITILALTYALWDVDIGELGHLMSGGDYLVIAPILVLLVLFYWIKALRWIIILRPLGRFSSTEVIPSMVIGFAGNNLLPAHLGELARIVVFARRFGKPYSSITATLLIERVFDMVAILSLYTVAMAAIGSPPESLKLGLTLLTLLIAAFLTTIGIILFKPELVLSVGNRLSAFLPAMLEARLNGILTNVIEAFASLKSPALVSAMLGWSLLKWSIMALIIWLSLIAYSTSVTAETALILMAVLALAAAVPNAPGYVGAIQAAYVFVLKPFGIPEEIAFAASVLFLVVQWVPVTAAGAAFFMAGGLHVDEMRREMEEVGEETADDRQKPADW